MVDEAKVTDVVYEAIREHNEQVPEDQHLAPSVETRLFRRGSTMDSLGLVGLVVAIEQGVAEACNTELSIVSEQAMSRQSSPFRTVGTLVDYVCELVNNDE